MRSSPVTDNELSGLEHRDAMLHQIDHRSAESFAYAREIQKPWGELEPVLRWCRAEITGEWRWQMVDMSTRDYGGRYIFYFDSERDTVAFALRWC